MLSEGAGSGKSPGFPAARRQARGLSRTSRHTVANSANDSAHQRRATHGRRNGDCRIQPCSELPQVGEQRGTLRRRKGSVDSHSVGRDDRRTRSRSQIDYDEFEERIVVVEYLFERVRAVVVEVRSRLGDVPERRGVQRLPVVTPSTSERRRTDGESREAGEERSAGVRGPLPRDLAVAPCDLVGTRVSQEPWCAGLEDEPRRALPAREVRPVYGTSTLRADGHVA